MSERRRRDLLTPLLVVLALILILAFWVFKSFLLVFAVAACVALLLAPLQKRLSVLLGGRPTLAASVLVLLTTVLLLVPVLTSLFLLVQQATTFLGWLQTQPLVGPETLERFWDELPQRYPGLGPWMSWVRSQVAPAVEGGLGQVAARASDLLQGVVGTLTRAVARPRPLPSHAVLPPARRRPAQVRAAAGLALLRAAGAADLRPPRAHDPGCPPGRDRRARGPGDPRRPRLHALRRPLAVRVGHGGDPRRDGAAPRARRSAGCPRSRTSSCTARRDRRSASSHTASWS